MMMNMREIGCWDSRKPSTHNRNPERLESLQRLSPPHTRLYRHQIPRGIIFHAVHMRERYQNAAIHATHRNEE